MAFGLHFALEYLAASLHRHLANGLEKYPALDHSAIEYFVYHRVAEQNHADWSEIGLSHYLREPKNIDDLSAGIDQGKRLLEALWDGFETEVLIEPGIFTDFSN